MLESTDNLYYIIDDEGTEVPHDSLRIYDAYALELIIKNSPQINSDMEEEIRALLFEFRNHKWEFKGDGGALGYIFDVWNGTHDDIIFSQQLWFEDYE